MCQGNGRAEKAFFELAMREGLSEIIAKNRPDKEEKCNDLIPSYFDEKGQTAMPRQSVPGHFQRGAADHRGVCEKQPRLKAVVCEVQGRGVAET